MGLRGPKPKPLHLKVLSGVVHKKPVQVGPIVQLNPGSPEKPAELFGEAAEEWDRVVPELAELGMLTTVDRAALMAYCQTWAEWAGATRLLQEEGRIIKEPAQTSRGEVIGEISKLHPAVKLQDQAFKRLTVMLAALGLTPSSRDRLGVLSSDKAAEATSNKILGIRDRIREARSG